MACEQGGLGALPQEKVEKQEDAAAGWLTVRADLNNLHIIGTPTEEEEHCNRDARSDGCPLQER